MGGAKKLFRKVIINSPHLLLTNWFVHLAALKFDTVTNRENHNPAKSPINVVITSEDDRGHATRYLFTFDFHLQFYPNINVSAR